MDKILVLHPNEANLDEILAKANKQDARIGPLLAVVLLGQRLPPVPPGVRPSAPTYCFSDKGDPGQFIDVAPNYTCVRAASNSPTLLRLASGTTLAFIDDSVAPELSSPPPETPAADVLFTYHWPSAMAAPQKLALVANGRLDAVVKSVRPRYHFSAGAEGRHYEAPPFSWTALRSCRFVSLAKEGSGAKWFYAFLISDAPDEPKSAANPYEAERSATQFPGPAPSLDSAKRPRAASEFVQAKQPRLDEASTARSKPREVLPLECFFCLANPRLESHMIVNIAKLAYVAIAKGPLTRHSHQLQMAGHGIIIPIDHRPKLAAADARLIQEIASYRGALVSMFDALNHDVVFFDFDRADNVHYHMQFVPVPRGVLGPDANHFRAVLREKVEYHNSRFSSNCTLDFKHQDPAELGGADFLRFSIHVDKKELILVSSLDGPVDLQFPRRVMAIVMKMPKRIKWDRCRQTKAQETSECEHFKQAFEPYDPFNQNTLES